MASILVVDDIEDIREGFADLFAKKNFNVSTAANGKEAIQILKEKNVDAVLSDIEMPCVNGLKLLEIMKHVWPSIPAFLMTGGIGPQATSLKELNAHAVFYKNHDTSEIVRKITDTILHLEK